MQGVEDLAWNLTFIEIRLVEVLGAGDVHVIQTGDLGRVRMPSFGSPCEAVRGKQTHIPVASEVLEELDLAQGALGENLLAKDIGDLFDGDALVGLVVHGGAVRATLAISYLKGGVGLRPQLFHMRSRPELSASPLALYRFTAHVELHVRGETQD